MLKLKKNRAICTIVHNEKTFLPIWYKYYSRFFNCDDIYIIDHDSTDGSTDGYPNVLKVYKDVVGDNSWMNRTVRETVKQLLRKYSTVVYAEADEFLIPNTNEYKDLGQYLDLFKGPYVTAKGLCVVHDFNNEPKLTSLDSILKHRKKGYFTVYMDKSLITKIPLEWHEGFHNHTKPALMDENLNLFHFKHFDYDLCWERHVERLDRPFSPKDLLEKKGIHNAIKANEEFKGLWMYNVRMSKDLPTLLGYDFEVI